MELFISHFIRPVESAELPNVARASKSLETPGLGEDGKVLKWILYDVDWIHLEECRLLGCGAV
jgi:hypothetical protein